MYRPTALDCHWSANSLPYEQPRDNYNNTITITVYTVSQKKTNHFNFRHNFAICWDIFTIFETPWSGIIAGWCNLLHTHHQCEAFTWRDVTHDVIQAVARRAHRHQISYHLTYGLWTHRTWILFTILSEVYAREGVPDTHSEYRRVETSASSGVGGAGPQTYPCSYRTAATLSQCVWLVCESSGGIFWPTFALNLHVALWAICWIVGLCNI